MLTFLIALEKVTGIRLKMRRTERLYQKMRTVLSQKVFLSDLYSSEKGLKNKGLVKK